jgi:hypothetical protein
MRPASRPCASLDDPLDVIAADNDSKAAYRGFAPANF